MKPTKRQPKFRSGSSSHKMLTNILVVRSRSGECLARVRSWSIAFVVLLMLTSQVKATMMAQPGALKYLDDIDAYLRGQGLRLGAVAAEDTDGVYNHQSTSMESQSSAQIQAPREQIYQQMTQIGRALREVRYKLESFLEEGNWDKTPVSERPGSTYWEHIWNHPWMEPSKMLSIIKMILESLGDCKQMSLDMIIVTNSKQIGDSPKERANDQNLISKLARFHVAECWQELKSSVAQRVDEAMSVVARPLFDLMELVAESFLLFGANWMPIKLKSKYNTKPKPEEVDDGQRLDLSLRPLILDHADEEPEQLETILDSLKSIDFSLEYKTWIFTLSINQLFLEVQRETTTEEKTEARSKLVQDFHKNYFVEPCRVLTGRVQSVVALGELYNQHISDSFNVILDEETKINARLDYELQIYRVCEEALGQTDKILKWLERLQQRVD